MPDAHAAILEHLQSLFLETGEIYHRHKDLSKRSGVNQRRLTEIAEMHPATLRIERDRGGNGHYGVTYVGPSTIILNEWRNAR